MRAGVRRVVLWAAFIVLLVAAQAVSLLLTFHYRASQEQSEIDARTERAAGGIEALFRQGLHAVLAMPQQPASPAEWRPAADALLLAHPELLLVERRNLRYSVVDRAQSRLKPPLFARMSRSDADIEPELACAATRRRGGPEYSRSYFVPQADGSGLEVMDVCIAESRDDAVTGFVTATFSLHGVLELAAASPWAPGHEMAFIEPDGAMLARSSHPSAQAAHADDLRSVRPIDLPGPSLQLRVSGERRSLLLLPDLVVALVVVLSLTLLAVVALLIRDGRRRSAVERELADSLAYRKAMENSVVTGLRAHDLDGRITYVNPAFCRMTGYAAAELVGRWPPPYWPADQVPAYEQRQRARLSSPSAAATAPATAPMTLPPSGAASASDAHDAFETVFIRRDGEAFDAMVFEAPLVDATGARTGSMSSILDVSAQRRVEALLRQQQDRLQATARLATVGEMASLLSHELNQPLAAIAAYANGSLNLLDDAADGKDGSRDETTGCRAPQPMLRHAVHRIAEQAERAGRVIKSVHNFVRRRDNGARARSPPKS